MSRAAFLVALALAAAGCDSHNKVLDDKPPLKAGGTINGHAVRGGTVAYMAEDAKITTDSKLIFHVADPENSRRSFWVLMGPATRSDGVVVNPTGGSASSGAGLFLFEGSAFLTGSLPWITSHIVNVASEGTTIYAEVFPASATTDEYARIMLVNNPSGLPVHIHNNLSAQDTTLTAVGTYVTVKAPTAQDPIGISAIAAFDPAITALVSGVKNAAITAGIPPEP